MQYQKQKLYTGNPRQLFSVRESRLLGGKMDGVRVADIHNGGNLEVCVAVDRHGNKVAVPPFVPQTEEEIQEYEAAKQRRALRLAEAGR